MMHADNPTSPGTWWQRQEFEPGILGWAVNPYYFARRGLLAGLREFFPELRGEVLDVGCGRKPYRAFIPDVRYARKSSERPR